MKLEDLNAAGLGHYGSVATAINYLEQRREADPKLDSWTEPKKDFLIMNNNKMSFDPPRPYLFPAPRELLMRPGEIIYGFSTDRPFLNLAGPQPYGLSFGALSFVRSKRRHRWGSLLWP
jgi:hypothetical protein